MAMQEHETRIVGDGRPSGVIASIVVVALLVLAFFLFFNWNGGSGTIGTDVPAANVDVNPYGQ